MPPSQAYDESVDVPLIRQVGQVLRQANVIMERIRAGEEIPLEEKITFQRFKVDTLRRVIDRTPAHHLTYEREVLLAAEQELHRLQPTVECPNCHPSGGGSYEGGGRRQS